MKKERKRLLRVNSTLQGNSLLLSLFACYLLIPQCYCSVEINLKHLNFRFSPCILIVIGFTLSQATKALRESRGIALLYLRPLH